MLKIIVRLVIATVPLLSQAGSGGAAGRKNFLDRRADTLAVRPAVHPLGYAAQ